MSSRWRRRSNGSWVKPNDDGTQSTLWGVASSGQPSPLGTVIQREHGSGRVDAIVTPAPVSLSTAVNPRPDSRPTSTTGTFRMTVADDGGFYVHLRDVERLIRDAGYANLSDLLVRACGQEPAQDRIVVPNITLT